LKKSLSFSFGQKDGEHSGGVDDHQRGIPCSS
jgi:hypothetical protein